MLIWLWIGFGRAIVFIDWIFDWKFENLDWTEIQVIFAVNTNGEDLGDLALTIPLHQTRVVVEERENGLEEDDGRREEEDTGTRGGFSPVSNISLEIVEGHSPPLPHMDNEK